jgi:ABC-type dipeptide/oligopeptide/nickel transport system permease subunit
MLPKTKKISGRDLATEVWIGANIAVVIVVTITVLTAFSL